MSKVIKECTVQEARFAIYSDSKNQLVDVREPQEYNLVSIPNSKFISISTLENDYIHIDNTTPVYLLCGHGKRACRAAEFLLSKGYKNLYVIQGGIKAWLDAGYAFVGDKNAMQ